MARILAIDLGKFKSVTCLLDTMGGFPRRAGKKDRSSDFTEHLRQPRTSRRPGNFGSSLSVAVLTRGWRSG
jgi:hypothetical protein